MRYLTRKTHSNMTLLTASVGGVTFAFTTRSCQNMGARTAEKTRAVAAHHAAVASALGMSLEPLRPNGLAASETAAEDPLFFNPIQVHEAGIHTVSTLADALTGQGSAQTVAADGILLLAPGLPCSLCFADCVPVLLIAPATTAPARPATPEAPARPAACALIHAGWRGCMNGIIIKGALQLAEKAGCKPRDLIAIVGPHIGAQAYEVSEELVRRFERLCAPTPVRVGARNLDLTAVVLNRLQAAGVPLSQVEVVEEGTESGEFFSHRAGDAQRIALVAQVDPPPVTVPTTTNASTAPTAPHHPTH